MKPTLPEPQKHPISKYVGVLEGQGQHSDDLVEALRGIQRGWDEMKSGNDKLLQGAFDNLRAKRKIPFPKS
ncbi:MAG: hypothetical protein WAO02_17210 [Verrucomicrobiia bacterium]